MKHLGTKTIETRRLVLRKFTLSDAEPMYRNWASDPEVTRYLLWPAHESEEETKGILKGWIAAYDKPEKYEWCIELKEIGEAIGSIGVVMVNEKVQSMEVGYCLSCDYWHKGIMSEALSAVVEYLTNEVGARRIQARCDTRNPYSAKVMEKCGLKYEGTAIQAAGKIHSDFERGFIRAEIVSYDDLIACGTHAAAREKGLVRLEGKDYVVQDGDIIVFRFNV